MEFIEAHHLTKVYGTKDNAFYALNDVSFSIDRGCFVAVTGASGSGKSTLLHILGAIDRPTSGKVYLNGVDVFKKRENDLAAVRRRLVGFIFQSFNLVPVLTVQENIMLQLKLANMKVNKKFMYELMDMLGIIDRRDRLPNQLSGGQPGRDLPRHTAADACCGEPAHRQGKAVLYRGRAAGHYVRKTYEAFFKKSKSHSLERRHHTGRTGAVPRCCVC